MTDWFNMVAAGEMTGDSSRTEKNPQEIHITKLLSALSFSLPPLENPVNQGNTKQMKRSARQKNLTVGAKT